jgi:hypothetical protein
VNMYYTEERKERKGRQEKCLRGKQNIYTRYQTFVQGPGTGKERIATHIKRRRKQVNKANHLTNT